MNDYRGNQRHAGGQRGGQKQQPWNVFRVKEVATRDGELKSDFQPCGVAWPVKDGEGFAVDVHFALPEGTRLLIKPRKQHVNGGGR